MADYIYTGVMCHFFCEAVAMGTIYTGMCVNTLVNDKPAFPGCKRTTSDSYSEFSNHQTLEIYDAAEG